MNLRTLTFTILTIITFCTCNYTEVENREIINLRAFAKVYGYVKYFHPSDESMEIDWDFFAIYGAKQVAMCKTRSELTNKLNELFLPIAPTIKFYSTYNELSEYNDDSLKPIDVDNYKRTFWQHEGLGLNMNKKYNYVYKSVRVNSFNQTGEQSKYGRILSNISIKDYIGKEFKFIAWVKLGENSKGTGHLRVEITNNDGTTGFFENMRKKPINHSVWKKYEIKGVIDSNAVNLNFGGQLAGNGSFFIDNTSLMIKENNKWVLKNILNSDFENQKIDENSGWKFSGLGYDYKLNKEDYHSGDKSLEIYFSGKLKRVFGEKIFEKEPEFNKFIKKQLYDSIYCVIPIYLYSNNEGTFPKPKKTKLDSLNFRLNKIKFDVEDKYSRIGNIINTYNVFQHFYPYMDVAKVDWGDELEKAIYNTKNDSTKYDYLLTLRKMTSPLKDGHIQVNGPAGMFYYRLPIYWEWLGEKLIITNIYDDSLPLKIGEIVTHINGKKAKEYFASINSTKSAGTKARLNYLAVESSIEGKEGSSLTIKTISGKSVKLIRTDNFYNSIQRKGIWMPEYKKIGEGVYYINLSKASMSQIDELIPKLKTSQGIIFDIRGYPNSNHTILNHLLKYKDTTVEWMKVPKIIYPDYENLVGFKGYSWNLRPKKPYLGDKKIIFLTNEKAISYSESILGYVKGYALGTIIGKPTAGTNGNINSFRLPGGYNIIWTGMIVTKHNGTELHGIGIKPDILIKESSESIIDNRDVYMDKALEIIGIDIQ